MSIVITPESKAAWTKAIEKAKLVKPFVNTVGFGQFDVTGSKGETYRVSFTRNEHGEFEVSCSCQGHKRGLACYHCPPCGSIFKLQVRERAQARHVFTLDCGECGEAFQTENSAQFFCTSCANKNRAEQILRDSTDIYTLPSLEVAKARCEAEKQALLATGYQPDEPSEPNDSALIECKDCGKFYPEASMTGGDGNAICDDCLMFGKPLVRLVATVSRLREVE